MLLGYGAKVGLGNMRVKAENRMVTQLISSVNNDTQSEYKIRYIYFLIIKFVLLCISCCKISPISRINEFTVVF